MESFRKMTKTDKFDKHRKDLQAALKAIKKTAETHFNAASNDKQRIAIINAIKEFSSKLETELTQIAPQPETENNMGSKKQASGEAPADDDCPEGFVKNRQGDCVPVR